MKNTRLSAFTSVAFVALALAAASGCAAIASDPAPTPAASSEPAPAVDAPKANARGTGETVSTKIDNATGGTVALSDGTAIEVPAGALPPGVDTITVTSSPAPAPADYQAASPVFVFGPDGTVFLKPLKVSIPVTVPSGKSTSDLTVLWSRTRDDGFDMVPTTFAPVAGTASSFIATGSVTHFSQGFCGVKYSVDPRPSTDPYQQ